MSKQGMIGMELATQEMLGIGEILTDEQWHLPSGAEGWSVKDVVAHAGCLMANLRESRPIPRSRMLPGPHLLRQRQHPVRKNICMNTNPLARVPMPPEEAAARYDEAEGTDSDDSTVGSAEMGLTRGQ
jgi:Mycothiol maleylpyruvate isomerase N-terminal domain